MARVALRLFPHSRWLCARDALRYTRGGAPQRPNGCRSRAIRAGNVGQEHGFLSKASLRYTRGRRHSENCRRVRVLRYTRT